MTTTTTTPTEPTSTPPVPANVNVSTSPAVTPAPIWTASRIIALAFSALEVLLLVRVAFKLFGANADQPLAAALYAITEPLVAPFRGIFTQPAGTQGFEIAAILSIVFFLLIGALVVAVVRAVTGRHSEVTA